MISQHRPLDSPVDLQAINHTTERSKRPPLPPEGQRQTLLTMLGIVLPVVAGSMVWWAPSLWGYSDMFDENRPFLIVTLATVLFSFLGAALLRSWWALLIVPLAWAIGETVALAVAIVVITSPDWASFWQITGVILRLAALPLVICAGLGALFGQWMTKRGIHARALGAS